MLLVRGMDVSTVLLRLLVGWGFVPVPSPGSPIASGKPEGRRKEEEEEKVKIKDKSGEWVWMYK